MKNRDELEGEADQVKGKVKQAWGDLTDDERLEGEGVADETSGNVQEGMARARRKVGETIEDVGENLKK
ncbi:MAG: CsbD family protein [Vicinamibacterales bacterium]